METQHMHIFKSGEKVHWQLRKWNGREWETAIGQASNLEQIWYSLKIPSRRLTLNTLHYLNSTLNFFFHVILLGMQALQADQRKNRCRPTLHSHFMRNLNSTFQATCEIYLGFLCRQKPLQCCELLPCHVT